MTILNPVAVALLVLMAGSAVAGDDVRTSERKSQRTLPMLADRNSDERPILLIVGTPHFANRGLDAINIEVPDVLTAERQQQLHALTQKLAAFKPTHVAVEVAADAQEVLDEQYTRYRAGTYQLSADEIDQIGLRVAALSGLRTVHAVDWNGMPPGELEYFDWYAYGRSGHHAARVAAITDPSRVPFNNLQHRDVRDWLLHANDPAVLSETHRIYFDVVMIGDEERQPGANWVGHWYARNLRIFKHLVDRGGELILLAPEGAPEPQLREFVREKRFWIYRKLAEKSQLQRPVPRKEYVDGEGFLYLGRSYRLKLVDAQDEPLQLVGGRFQLRRELASEGRGHFVRWYSERGGEWLAKKAAEHAPRLGVSVQEVFVQDLGYRWGSCGKGSRLYFHWKTVLLPRSIAEYVIIHELVHLQMPHHTPEFWQRLERVLPGYERRKQWLAQHGMVVEIF